MENLGEQYWHSMPLEEVFARLQTSEDGLAQATIQKLLNIYGLNTLPQPKKRNLFQRFISQFHNILIYVLLISAIITVLLAHWIDSSVIFSVIIINAIIGCIQEGKAEAALDAIKHMLSQMATVIRAEQRHTIDAKELVPGDIVILQSGDKVPADLRLFSVKNLQIQEAILTGESNPIEKSLHPVPASASLADRTSVAFSGTFVTYGTGKGIVIATGQNTEIGKISSLVNSIKNVTTPLLKQMQTFSYWLTLFIGIMALIPFIVGTMVWHLPPEPMFMAAIGMAVAAIPEGLPPIITITLALGVTRMAKRNAIIRRLPAVETMGAVSVICTDKTGTLTHNELTVQNIITIEHTYHVTGSGYDPTGDILIDGKIIHHEKYKDLQAIILAGILCNDAEIIQSDNIWKLSGHPVDGALLTLGNKIEFNASIEREIYSQIDFIPFSTEYKFMATLRHNHKTNGYIHVKGAPERIFARCKWQTANDTQQPFDLPFWESRLTELAQTGERVVAIAMRSTDASYSSLNFDDINSLTILGLVGITDPPREDAIQAVADCYKAGIRIKMITGDHALTAKAIAEQVGIHNGHGVLIGQDIDDMTDEELSNAVQQTDIYARTSPTHKLRLVQALQTNHSVVAMTGDGVNDAPALRQADIGIAMGKKGTEAAKETSEMILVDDNFAAICYAIKEGRTIFDNIKKTILYILPTNGAQTFSLMLAILIGSLLPITAIQILWVNMVTAITLALALSFEPPEPDVMLRSPRAPQEPILSKFLVWRIIFVTILLVSCVFGLFLYELKFNGDLLVARTSAVNMLVAGEIVYLLNCRQLSNGILSLKQLFSNLTIVYTIVAVILLQLVFTYMPIMQHFFATTAISLKTWLIIIVLSLIVFVFVEIEKILVLNYGFHAPTTPKHL